MSIKASLRGARLRRVGAGDKIRGRTVAKNPKGTHFAEGFRNQVVVITGAGSGIGRATALTLARRGLSVAVLDNNRERAHATVESIATTGGKARAYVVDVSRSKQVDRVFARIAKQLGPVGYLVNIAGVDAVSPLEKITDDGWARMFAVAVNGCFYCCRAALPGMMERRFGSIVNMSSLHAIRGQSNRAHYAASKAAIIGLTKSLAREKAPYGIRVNAVAPGPIDTPLWRAGRGAAGLKMDIAERVKVIPLGRLGSAGEIAESFTFLLSDHASYVTGHVLTADGGEIMP